MTWLPWTLEYTKRGMEFAIKKAAEAKAADAARTTSPPDDAAESPYASEYKRSDRPTVDERATATRHLEAQGFTDIHLPDNGAYFYQLDKRWAGDDYPKVGLEPYSEGGPKRTIGGEGCAPSALAIVDATLRGTKTTPPEVADFAKEHKRNGKPGGYGSNTPGLVKDWAEEHNLNRVEIKDKDMEKLRDGLGAGGVAVVMVKPNSIFNKGGHVIAITGYAVDKDGKEWFFVADPGHKNPKTSDDLVVDDELHRGAGRVRVSKEALEKDMRTAYVLSNPA
jgi:hypothetical protein